MLKRIFILVLVALFGAFGFYYLKLPETHDQSGLTPVIQEQPVKLVSKSKSLNLVKTEEKKMNKDEHIERVSELSNISHYFTAAYRGVQTMTDQLMKTGSHSEETLKLFQHFLDTFQDPDRGVKIYKEALSRDLSQPELKSLIQINSHPLIERYNNQNEGDEANMNEYRDFVRSFQETENPARAELINSLNNKLGTQEHSFRMTKATLELSARLLNKPDMADKAVLKAINESMGKAAAVQMHFKCRGFSDQELSEVIALKTQLPALKEEKIRQAILEKMMGTAESQAH